MNLQQHRRDRDRAVNVATTAVCGLGLAGALSPAAEHAIGAALVTLAALAVIVGLTRWGLRIRRERREDVADALAAAAWRARHMPHLAAQLDQADQHDQHNQHGAGRDRAEVA